MLEQEETLKTGKHVSPPATQAQLVPYSPVPALLLGAGACAYHSTRQDITGNIFRLYILALDLINWVNFFIFLFQNRQPSQRHIFLTVTHVH